MTPRQDVPSADVDDGGPRGRSERLRRDLSNLSVTDDQGRIGRDLASRSVRDVRTTQYHDILLRSDVSGHKNRRQSEQEASFHGCFPFF